MILSLWLLVAISAQRVNLTNQLFRPQHVTSLGRRPRTGEALCKLRELEEMNVCCDGISLHCYGCNPNLLALGIKCEDQPTAKVGTGIVGKDCFCDESCRDFKDCCDDYDELCPDPDGTTARPSPVTTSIHQTTKPVTTHTTTRKTTKSTTTQSTHTPPTTASSSTSALTTTPAQTKGSTTTATTLPTPTESWILSRLFAALKMLIETKFGHGGMGLMQKYDNVKFFYLHAEHNCKVVPSGDKALLSDEYNTKMFNGLLRKVEKKQNMSIDEKLDVMGQGLVSYTETYFYNAQVRETHKIGSQK